MFDTIVVAEKLPFNQEMVDFGIDKKALDFQTKDLDNCLDLYFIQSGKLYIQKYKKSGLSDEDSEEKSDPYQEEVNFHGEINFYTYEADATDSYDFWIEYKATFTHGNLEKIDLLKFDKIDNTENKRRIKFYAEEELKIRSRWYNKYLKFNTIKLWIKYNLVYSFLINVRKVIDKIINRIY